MILILRFLKEFTFDLQYRTEQTIPEQGRNSLLESNKANYRFRREDLKIELKKS